MEGSTHNVHVPEPAYISYALLWQRYVTMSVVRKAQLNLEYGDHIHQSEDSFSEWKSNQSAYSSEG